MQSLRHISPVIPKRHPWGGPRRNLGFQRPISTKGPEYLHNPLLPLSKACPAATSETKLHLSSITQNALACPAGLLIISLFSYLSHYVRNLKKHLFITFALICYHLLFINFAFANDSCKDIFFNINIGRALDIRHPFNTVMFLEEYHYEYLLKDNFPFSYGANVGICYKYYYFELGYIQHAQSTFYDNTNTEIRERFLFDMHFDTNVEYKNGGYVFNIGWVSYDDIFKIIPYLGISINKISYVIDIDENSFSGAWIPMPGEITYDVSATYSGICYNLGLIVTKNITKNMGFYSKLNYSLKSRNYESSYNPGYLNFADQGGFKFSYFNLLFGVALKKEVLK